MKLANKFKTVLLESGLVKKSKLDAYLLDVTTEKVMSEDERGLLLGYSSYNAMYEVEDYTGTDEEIQALVILFLDTEDEWRDEYELEDPSIDVTDGEGNTVSLSILIPFYEPLYLHKSETGSFSYNGVKYSMGEGSAEYADGLMGINPSIKDAD